MESFGDTGIILFSAFILTFLLEIVRFSLLRSLGLNLAWVGGWRYTYYLSYLAICAGFGSGLAVFVTALFDWTWRYIIKLPGALYLGGFFLVFLTGIIVFLLYMTLYRVKSTREMLPILVFLVLFYLITFIWRPTRFIFGGTLLLLVSSAFGQLVRFTGWQDIVQWLGQDKEGAAASGGERDRVGVLLFIETEGVLVRRGGRLELKGEQISGPADGRVETLAQRLLERSRLTEIVAEQERLKDRADLQDELPRFIAQNVGKLIALRESLLQEEGTAEEKAERMEEEVSKLLDQGLGDWLRALLYWHYDLPQDEARLFIARAPRAVIKPLITLREYLGLFLSYWMRRSKGR